MDGPFYDMFRESVIYHSEDDEETVDNTREDPSTEQSPNPE